MKSYGTSWLNPRVVVALSPIEGRGLFARAKIEAGEVVVRLGGEVLADEEFRARRPIKYSALGIDDGLNPLLDEESPVTFGNHSCDANLWMADEVTLIARHRIEAGDEVTIDYALHTADPSWSMACRCGFPVCRGVVTHEDWQRRDVRERYAGHVRPFLNRRIATPGTP
ncbi:MAG: SET domain-containing protein-lysine N-methyltransferase [Chloroflexota bacterium]|nr:SET domain-containing protein-lysine N-methyltransferase [Chloroflexota bacterium]